MLAALCAALAMVISALAERSAALPVSTAVWCVPLGLVAMIGRDRARRSSVPTTPARCAPARGSRSAAPLAILLGAWQALRDERPSLYKPATPPPRPRP